MSRSLVMVVFGAVVLLAACGQDDDRAELEERVAELENRIDEPVAAEADGDGAEEELASEDGETDQGGEGDADEQGADETDADDPGEPAEPRTVEIGESQELDGITVTVERLVIEQFHTEVEISAVNTTADSDVGLVNDARHGSPSRIPALFDERDRRFIYQHAAGLSERDMLGVGPGERLEAALVFRGAVQPDAQTVSFVLDLKQVDRGEPRWDIDVTGANP